jgi:signal transduction histidine kinase/DNA-binding NarL/FixJ family response regulator
MLPVLRPRFGRLLAFLLGAAVVLGGLAASWGLYRATVEEEQEERRAALAVRAESVALHLEAQLRGARAAVAALSAHLLGTTEATDAIAEPFALELQRELRGLDALGVAGVEPDSAGMRLRLLATNGAAAGVEGLDLGARADLTAVLALADATTESVLTGRVLLGDGGAGVLLVRAVPRVPGSKRRYAVAVMRPQVLLAAAIEQEAGVQFGLLDRSALMDNAWLAGVPSAPDEAHRDIHTANRLWSVVAVPAQVPTGLPRSVLLLALGVLATAAATTVAGLLFRWRARVALEAGWRTRDLQLALRKLEASQQRFEDFLAAASDWYWETDAQYRFTFRSAGAPEAGGQGEHVQALIGLDRLTEDDPEMEIAPRRAMLDRHRAFARLRCILTTEEGQQSISFTGRPVFGPDGTFLGYRGSARDVTAAAKAEAAERMARVAAESATRAKSNFLANMSHEIRTPMNGMIGMAQILRHSGLDPAQRRNVDLILRSANSLLTVLNDILDYSKLEVGSIQMEAVPCQLADLMEEVASLVRQTSEEKGVAMHCVLPPVPPPAVMGDPVRLRQILMNLVSNAVKFTSQGSVRLMLTCQEPVPTPAGGPPRVEMRIAVADTGIGMDQQTIARLFTRFMQADPSSTRRFGGTGLGLSIAQELARMMGGQVVVESRLGEGSTFTLVLSLALAPETVAAPEAEELSADWTEEDVKLRILAAEDDEINRMVLSGFITPYGHALTLVGDGAEAVAAVQREAFDIVLMDVMMPKLDGVQATRAIRALPPPYCEVPIIALTANALAGHREEYLKAGMDDYVSKPISRAALYRAVERRLGLRAFSRVSAEAAPAEPASPPLPPSAATDPGAMADLTAFMASLEPPAAEVAR